MIPIEAKVLTVFVLYVIGLYVIFDWIDRGNKRK